MLAVLRESVTITIFVFSMMVLVDWLNVLSRGGMTTALRGRKWREYVLSSLLGSTPGCLGAFMNVSMYVHGLIGFGAIVGGMIATSGDEAYIMLAKFPKQAVILFGALFLSGIFFGWLSDWMARRLGIVACKSCQMHGVHPAELGQSMWETIRVSLSHPSLLRIFFLSMMIALLIISSLGVVGPPSWGWMRITLIVLLSFGTVLGIVTTEHYMRVHIVNHVIRKHVLRVFLWTFGALLVLSFLPSSEVVREFIQGHIWAVFLFAGLLGVIPESGPHMMFVMMFAAGMIPFSVLFVSSFVQDGHGMLPLLSVSLRDTLLVKGFNLFFGLSVGGLLYALGM